MAEFDVIVVGARHNRLAAGCYLAKTGLQVSGKASDVT